MKKSFTLPFVLMSPAEPEPTSVVGGGTGQGGTDPLTQAMSYSSWIETNIWEDFDDNGNGHADWEDYLLWWTECGFPTDLWDELNPQNPYPGPVNN
ncbi:MAG: hypothetical protein II155_08080 [Clostridia bacterium]|nr:hypothetical protein [Clostridia bacterium]